MIFTKNPAVYIGLIGAGLSLAIAFGLKVTDVQSGAIMTFVNILIPIVVGLAIRSQVYPAESMQLGLDQKQGISLEQFDKVLAKTEEKKNEVSQ